MAPRVIASSNVEGVPDSSKTPLSERIDAVCRARGYETEREWCDAAGYSPGYLATLRNRAKNAAEFRLPEKVATKLARVARVSLEWLRDGTGPMELSSVGTGAASGTVPEGVELALLDAIRLGEFSSEDGVAARAIVAAGVRFIPRDRAKATEVIGRLLAAVRDARAASLPVAIDSLMWVLLGAFPPLAAKKTRAA